MPGEPQMPKRSIRGLDGPCLNVREFLNKTQTTVSLAQLCDISPAVRAEFAQQLTLLPDEKKKKAAKRAKQDKGAMHVNLATFPSDATPFPVVSAEEVTIRSHKHHDDAVVPLMQEAVA